MQYVLEIAHFFGALALALALALPLIYPICTHADTDPVLEFPDSGSSLD